MDDLEFIIGLMRENTDALGFIPEPTVAAQYVSNGRYLIQQDGKHIGYLLHGKPSPGGILTIAQAVIDYDLRDLGHGHDMVSRLIDRANQYNAKSIKLRCANSYAVRFWQSCGFSITKIDMPPNRRRRKVTTMMLDLWPTLFNTEDA